MTNPAVPGPQSPVRPRSGARKNHEALLVLGAGFVLGFMIWFATPGVFGREQAWAVKGLYYWGSLFVGGALASFFGPRWFLLSGIGIFAGQSAYMLAYDAFGLLGSFELVGVGVFSPVSILGGWVVYLGFGRRDKG